MSECQDNRPTFLPEAVWKALMNLPALRYMKAPVDSVSELYHKYPIGNEKGTFAFVHDENTFYTYHPRGWNRGRWKPISGDIASFFEIDIDFLKEGDILVYDNNKKKFVVKSGNVWNQLLGDLKGKFIQVTKFLNHVDKIPTDKSDSGVYFVHNNDITGLYLVINESVTKIFNSSDFYFREKIDELITSVKELISTLTDRVTNVENNKVDKSELPNISVGIKQYKASVTDIADLPKTGNEIGDARVVISDLDTNGRSFIWLWNGTTWSRTAFTSLPKDIITGADVNIEALKLLFVNNEGTNLIVIADKDDRIIALWDKQGKLHTKLAHSVVGYDALSIDLKKIMNYASRLSENIFLSEGQYLTLYTDNKGKILEYYDKKGVKHIEKAKIENLDNPTLNILKNAVHLIDSGYIYAELDSKGNIIEATRKDGTKYIEKLSVGSLKGYESGGTAKSRINDLTSAHIPRPAKNFAPTINIIGTLPTIKGNPTIVQMEFIGFDVLPFTKYAKTDVQGNSSKVHPKKNLSIDLFNDAACTSEFKLKIGSWVYQDSNHMKANYINITQANNVASANIANEAYNIMPKPWFRTSDFENSNFYDDFDLSPRCVIDGFAVRVLNNGTFHGYYTYNLKKHRANYHMDKNDKKAILLDCSNNYTFLNPFDYNNWELRNPKLKGYEENGVIEDAGVLADINRFWDWVKATKASTIRNDAKDYIDMDNTLIHILLIDFLCAIDCVQKNSLIEIRNNIVSHWIYDLDNTFGFRGWDVGTYRILDPDYAINFAANGFFDKVIAAYGNELNATYAELRNRGIFSVANVEVKFREIMDSIGYDGFVEEFDKWKQIPSYTEVKDSLARTLDFTAKRISHLDNKYSYNI